MRKSRNFQEKYHFDDFTENSYRECLKITKSRYRFIRFTDYQINVHVCLWRHDIDTSPHRALSLARIENQEDVTSTYFFLFHSDRYNAFDRANQLIMREIISLGHTIGLHFDPMYYDNSNHADREMILNLRKEKDILSDITREEVKVFSFHNPSTNKLLDIEQEIIGGMINAYSGYIKENFEYCSDSFCYWRFRRLIEIIQDSSISKLHILTHPVCWTPEPLSPYARFRRAVNGRAKNTMRNYKDKAKLNKRKIIR